MTTVGDKTQEDALTLSYNTTNGEADDVENFC